MKLPGQSKLGSILFSTVCIVAFGLLADPVIQRSPPAEGGIDVLEGASAERTQTHLRVAAGKSVIMESSVRIVRASVDNPDLARAVSIDEHQLLLNAKTPGSTQVRLWQEDGVQRQFDLHIDSKPFQASAPEKDAKPETGGRGLTAAYENAMGRIQTAITGANR